MISIFDSDSLGITNESKRKIFYIIRLVKLLAYNGLIFEGQEDDVFKIEVNDIEDGFGNFNDLFIGVLI